MSTANLYKSLQANTTYLQKFNSTYKTYLPKQGSPTSVDRGKIFGVTAVTGYSQSTFLNNLVAPLVTASPADIANSALIDALKTDSAQAQNLNLLYGTSFNSSGPTTAYDNTVITNITSASGYNQTAYLNSLMSTANLYKSLQANTTYLQKFNEVYTTYLQSQGFPAVADRVKLFVVSGTEGYVQSVFLENLITPETGQLFAATSFWNTALSPTETLNPNSANLVNELVAQTRLSQPWMNTKSYSTGIYEVDASVAKVPVYIVQNGQQMTSTVLYGVMRQGVPIPEDAVVAAGTDGHITILDSSTDTLYEFWQLQKVNGQWQASWGGVITNYSASNGIMPVVKNQWGDDEYWGATATGLPVAGGVITLAELSAGVINHVLAMAIPDPKNTYVSPATRTDGTAIGINSIPEGTIFRFPADIYIDPSWSPLMQMIVVAIRDYGAVVRDKAGCVTFYGEDPSQYGSGDPYAAYYGGDPLWDVMNQMPWSRLQVVN
jgi:hypothetical protein